MVTLVPIGEAHASVRRRGCADPRIEAHLNEFLEAPDIANGVVTLPDRPGLGLVWHEDAIARRLG